MKSTITLLFYLGLIAGIGYLYKERGELMTKIEASQADDQQKTDQLTKLQSTESQDQQKIEALQQELKSTQADLETARAAQSQAPSPSPTTSTAPSSAPAQNTAPNSPVSVDTQAIRANIALIEGNTSGGSGFVAQLKQGPQLVTNAHILCGNTTVKATFVDGKSYSPDVIQVAEGSDVAIFTPDLSQIGLEIVDDITNNVAVGDAVLVMGSGMQGDLVKDLKGKVTGIGPNLVDIDVQTQFVPGNSGLPIIHLKTGKVIGIATYSIISKLVGSNERDTKFHDVIRRFAFRLDSISNWRTIHWADFVAEDTKIAIIRMHTQQLIDLLHDGASGRFQWDKYSEENNCLKSIASDLHDKLSQTQMGGDYYQRAKLDFFQAASEMCTQEVSEINTSSYTSYHKEELDALIDARKQISTILAHLSNIQNNSHNL